MQKKISASQVIKLIFPDAYKDIPEFVLEQAAEFGKDLHESFEIFIKNPEMENDIVDSLISDKKKRLFASFKNWYQEQDIKHPLTEYFLETSKLHGYVDLLTFEKHMFYDYKFRNVDDKLNITKDVYQMVFYQMLIEKVHNAKFGWELIIFDKKTAKIFKFNSANVDLKDRIEIETNITNAIRILEQKQKMKNYNYDDLDGEKKKVIKW